MAGNFKIEYSPSNRAVCKGCKKNIGHGSIRIAKMVQSPFFDGVMPLWFHQACLFAKHDILSLSLLQGLEEIRWEDQEKIKKKIKPICTEAEVVSALISDSFIVDYAKSGRSTCKHCLTGILQGSLRVGKMVESDKFAGMIPAWNHVDCFFLNEVLVDLRQLEGIKNVAESDQKILLSRISELKGKKEDTEDLTNADIKRKREETCDTSPKKKGTPSLKSEEIPEHQSEEVMHQIISKQKLM